MRYLLIDCINVYIFWLEIIQSVAEYSKNALTQIYTIGIYNNKIRIGGNSFCLFRSLSYWVAMRRKCFVRLKKLTQDAVLGTGVLIVPPMALYIPAVRSSALRSMR